MNRQFDSKDRQDEAARVKYLDMEQDDDDMGRDNGTVNSHVGQNGRETESAVNGPDMALGALNRSEGQENVGRYESVGSLPRPSGSHYPHGPSHAGPSVASPQNSFFDDHLFYHEAETSAQQSPVHTLQPPPVPPRKRFWPPGFRVRGEENPQRANGLLSSLDAPKSLGQLKSNVENTSQNLESLEDHLAEQDSIREQLFHSSMKFTDEAVAWQAQNVVHQTRKLDMMMRRQREDRRINPYPLPRVQRPVQPPVIQPPVIQPPVVPAAEPPTSFPIIPADSSYSDKLAMLKTNAGDVFVKVMHINDTSASQTAMAMQAFVLRDDVRAALGGPNLDTGVFSGQVKFPGYERKVRFVYYLIYRRLRTDRPPPKDEDLNFLGILDALVLIYNYAVNFHT